MPGRLPCILVQENTHLDILTNQLRGEHRKTPSTPEADLPSSRGTFPRGLVSDSAGSTLHSFHDRRGASRDQNNEK